LFFAAKWRTRVNVPSIREFRLSPPRTPSGISCDTTGAFIGGIPLLKAVSKDGRSVWHPRETQELSAELSRTFGLPVDATSKQGALNAIARALNKGEIAKAQLVTLHMEIPDPPPLAKATGQPRADLARLAGALSACGLLKADWDSDEHPRWPAGAPDSQGGQFAPKGEDTSGSQNADASVSLNQSDSGQNSGSDVRQEDESGIADTVLRDDQSTSPIPVAAFGGDDGEFEPAQYRGEFHDEVVTNLANYFRKKGLKVETEISLAMADGSAGTRIDILARGKIPFGIEVKTGANPFPTMSQLLIYPHLMWGASVVSFNPRIISLGLLPGRVLPPMPVILVYVRDANSEPIFKSFNPKKMLEEYYRLLRLKRTQK
jgi:hypothetical protein